MADTVGCRGCEDNIIAWDGAGMVDVYCRWLSLMEDYGIIVMIDFERRAELVMCVFPRSLRGSPTPSRAMSRRKHPSPPPLPPSSVIERTC